jgi:hypothetical protein
MTTREQTKVQEDLVSLYMRLNGFFVSGFIVHSPEHGNNFTELDALAIRMPYSYEPEREIDPDPLLDLSTRYTDLVLCEVKSGRMPIRFNNALTDNPSAIETILRWAGLWKKSELNEIADNLRQAMLHPKNNTPATVKGPRNTRVRALLFGPDRRTRHHNQSWFITGPELMTYIWRCLVPSVPRIACATTYDPQPWGPQEHFVRYFKSRQNEGPGDMQALYAYMENDT